MQLTGNQIVHSGVITNYVPEAIQQQGLDLRLMQVFSFKSGLNMSNIVGNREQYEKHIQEIGHIPSEGKTLLPAGKTEIFPISGDFMLDSGYYEIIMMEGCKIPNNLVINNIKSRSSLVRCGAEIVCGQFDAGFSTDHIGCFMAVHVPIMIAHRARIGQVQVFETEPVAKGELYNGQWQGDKQRTV